MMVWALYWNLLLKAEVWAPEVWHGIGHWWAAKTPQVLSYRERINQSQLPAWILTILVWTVILSDFTTNHGCNESVLDTGDLQGKSIGCKQTPKIVAAFFLHVCKPDPLIYRLIKNKIMLFHGSILVNVAHRKWKDKKLWVLSHISET